ncbi:MAG: respiratory nitrate reductase subunit gamma [Bacillota bacterium]|nr:respiratory nitrate reductase subunit gamma [Bacillota bacterium]
MHALAYWITGPGVYLAVGVFALGLGYRLYQWRRMAASPMRLGIFPKPPPGAKVLRIVADTLAFPQLAEVNPSLWVAAIVFHVALLGVFVGHLHLLGRFPGQLEEMMTANASLVGGTMGVLWALAALYLLIRRFKTPYKEISTPEDYLLLLLILGAVVMGDHLRFFGHVDVGVYQEYIRSLYAFRPELPAALATSSVKWSFVVHILLANLLLIYLPFSKLVHFIGAFFTNGIRRG